MIPNLEIPIAGGLNVALPKMAMVRQRFDDSRLDDVCLLYTSDAADE